MRSLHKLSIALLAVSLAAGVAHAEGDDAAPALWPPKDGTLNKVNAAPVGSVSAAAPKNDDGTNIAVTFGASPDEKAAGATKVTRYLVLRAPEAFAGQDPSLFAADFVAKSVQAGVVEATGDDSYTLTDTPPRHVPQVYVVVPLTGAKPADTGFGVPSVVGPVATETSYFHTDHWFVFLSILLMGALIAYFYAAAKRRGKDMYIRRIAGIDAMDEAIGRATEMGRPVLYVPGVEEIQDLQTIASILILGHVAETVAKYGAEIKVPCMIPLVMTIAEEVVREGFVRAGHPDAHKPHNIQFISSEQFAFTAGTNGIILRDKPATNIYLGRFYAESLMLAETGYINRSIQIAGTAEITQLPFFIAACDYTIIGEELFAVSAYLSREPRLLSSLKASDYFKVALIAFILFGAVWMTWFHGSSKQAEFLDLFFPGKLTMKKTVPLLITFFLGVVGMTQFFVPAKGLRDLLVVLQDFGGILASAAFLLGGINIMQVNVPIVMRRRPDWGYKVALLLSAAVTLVLGIKWHEYYAGGPGGSVAISPNAPELAGRTDLAGSGWLDLDASTHNRIIVKLDGLPVINPKTIDPKTGLGAPAQLPFHGPVSIALDPTGKPTPHKISFEDYDNRYTSYETTVTLAAGSRATVRANLHYLFGPDGQTFMWLFNYIFAPCNATMFALLAFFITSAAFRAFRARNFEAILLLGSALLVMCGTIPLGAYLSHTWLSGLQESILAVPNVAGRRAIMMGAALGAVAIGLRVILGLERSHLGGD